MWPLCSTCFAVPAEKGSVTANSPARTVARYVCCRELHRCCTVVGLHVVVFFYFAVEAGSSRCRPASVRTICIAVTRIFPSVFPAGSPRRFPPFIAPHREPHGLLSDTYIDIHDAAVHDTRPVILGACTESSFEVSVLCWIFLVRAVIFSRLCRVEGLKPKYSPKLRRGF